MHIMSSTRLPAYYTILQDLEEKNKGGKSYEYLDRRR